MKSSRWSSTSAVLFTAVFCAGATLLAARAHAGADVDPQSLYDVSTDGTTEKLKKGGAGRLVLSIRTKPGAHVSDEAPLKIELGSTNVRLEKERLTLSDSVIKKGADAKWVDPRFEVPFHAESAGKSTISAKVTFYICTDQLCARQQKMLQLPVEVM